MKTKHDLSAGKAVLNLQELVVSLTMGMVALREECNRHMNRIQNIGLDYAKDKTEMCKQFMYSSGALAEAAEKMSHVATSLHYAQEAVSRDEIRVQNDESRMESLMKEVRKVQLD